MGCFDSARHDGEGGGVAEMLVKGDCRVKLRMEDGCINTDEQGNIETFGLNLAAIAVVAAGYGGYMDEELANALLDDMDFDRYGRVKCRKIEGMLPKLMKMVEGEMVAMLSQHT